MKKYKYEKITGTIIWEDDFIDELNRLGEQGYRSIHFVERNGYYTAILVKEYTEVTERLENND